MIPQGIGLTLQMVASEIRRITDRKPTIALDGHSSSGKSTLAKDLSKVLQLPHIDTGAMYRAVTWYGLEHDLDWSDIKAVERALTEITLRFQFTEEGCAILCNDQDISYEIRRMRVSHQVSEVATISAVRRAMVTQQRAMAQDQGVIMDGRDIGSVVFPDADIKLFVTASIDVRTDRRYHELLGRGVEIERSAVMDNLQHRDKIDSTREDSPLVQTNDAILIDTSEHDRQGMLHTALQIISQSLSTDV